MELLEALKARHSVRSYTDEKIEGEVLEELRKFTAACNLEGDVSIQLCIDEPDAFAGAMARYGNFVNVKNYIALVAKKDEDFSEKCGYYGQKVVLKAQQLGLNTCWVAMNFNKSKSKDSIKINADEKLSMVISLGYGVTGGVSRKSKTIEQLSEVNGVMPDWFRSGMEAVMLAPTSANHQKFKFTLNNNNKVSTSEGFGFYTKVDLGIAKYHFEIGAGETEWGWEE